MAIRISWWLQGARFICRVMTWPRLRCSRRTKNSLKNINFQLHKIGSYWTKSSTLNFTHTRSPKMRISHGFMTFRLLSIPLENTGFMLYCKKPYFTQTPSWLKSLLEKANKPKRIWHRKKPKNKNVAEEPNNRKSASSNKSWENSKNNKTSADKPKNEPNKHSKNTWKNNNKWSSSKPNKEEPDDSYKQEAAST